MDIREIAARIPADKAQLAVARVFVALGSQFDWDSGTLDHVAEAVASAHPQGLPSVFDQDEAAVEFWENVR
ncbi:hypothetical protein SEA_SERENITY_96 [Mycobacterium phage Serenity]|uniref:hypothetical protein n=1 Tax=Mycobacterium phage Serenity TaxID=1701853 RepID=UPI0006CE2E2E|nr:hypothetical protein SEA_SERENITY_96 [Mycobacterium phage Serenity]ALF00963.1 hypothetical protein SEA_SERENITY_96 [Mycobacterium phage Serenity]